MMTNMSADIYLNIPVITSRHTDSVENISVEYEDKYGIASDSDRLIRIKVEFVKLALHKIVTALPSSTKPVDLRYSLIWFTYDGRVRADIEYAYDPVTNPDPMYADEILSPEQLKLANMKEIANMMRNHSKPTRENMSRYDFKHIDTFSPGDVDKFVDEAMKIDGYGHVSRLLDEIMIVKASERMPRSLFSRLIRKRN
jgi:hypothetical protein